MLNKGDRIFITSSYPDGLPVGTVGTIISQQADVYGTAVVQLIGQDFPLPSYWVPLRNMALDRRGDVAAPGPAFRPRVRVRGGRGLTFMYRGR
jgi:hypothetical protein